jgi:hypothetical protein
MSLLVDLHAYYNVATFFDFLKGRKLIKQAESLKRVVASLSFRRSAFRRQGSEDPTNSQAIDWFQHQYRILQGEVSLERQQWAEEMTTLSGDD